MKSTAIAIIKNKIVAELQLTEKLYKIRCNASVSEERAKILALEPDLVYEIFTFVKSLKLIVVDDQKRPEFEISFAAMTTEQLEQFLDYADHAKLQYSVEDITDKILFNKYVEDTEKHESYLNIILFNPFLLENLTVDFVLDKISNDGIESLTEIEQQILKNS